MKQYSRALAKEKNIKFDNINQNYPYLLAYRQMLIKFYILLMQLKLGDHSIHYVLLFSSNLKCDNTIFLITSSFI